MNYIIYIVLVGLVVFIAFQAYTAAPKVGSKAPEFNLQDENGQWRTLASFGDGKIVLYFYPKDFTSGCTKQACSLRDGYADLQQHNITIIGVSFDSPESHLKFKQQYKLPFTLLSDVQKKAARAYGTYRWYTWFVPKRYTFLIEGGRIKAILKDIDVQHHSDQILKVWQ